MLDSSSVSLVRAAPATVLADYRRLLRLATQTQALCGGALFVYGDHCTALPGERVEPWQLDGTLRMLTALAGAPPTVIYTSAAPADAVAAVACAAGAPLVRECNAVPRVVLCAIGQLTGLARQSRKWRGKPALLAPASATLYIVDATTVRTCSQLEIRGALLASTDLAALVALVGWLCGHNPRSERPAQMGLRGDIALAVERWGCGDETRTSPSFVSRLAEHAARAVGLRALREQQAYEDWVFHTSWGRLYRSYQRRAVASR